MKTERKKSVSRNPQQDILPQPSSTRALSNHKDCIKQSQSNNKCVRCKSSQTKKKPVNKSQCNLIHSKLKQKQVIHKYPVNKSVFEETEDRFSNDQQSLVGLRKRQSNSYSKAPRQQHESSQQTLYQTATDNEDGFYERKYKQSQSQLIKKEKKENKLMTEKVTHLESEIQLSTKKTFKYKKIAKQFKQNLDQIENTLTTLKKLSHQEITQLRQQVQHLENLLTQKSNSYQSNIRTIGNYLQRLQKMITPSDQNYSFNVKILGDLTDLCGQIQKMQSEEEINLKESLLSLQTYNNKGNEEIEFVFSQTTMGQGHTQQKRKEQEQTARTKRILDDYERLRFESEHIKQENQKLKVQMNSTNEIKIPALSNYDSKESLKYKQSLSVGDLMHFDSVQQLNSKLEVKNQNLEDQLRQMKQQMEMLALETRELANEREQFRQQIHSQNDYIIQIANQNKNVFNSTQSNEKINYEQDSEYTTQQSDTDRKPQQFRQNQEEIKTQKVFNQVSLHQPDFVEQNFYDDQRSPSENNFPFSKNLNYDQLEYKDNGHVSFKKVNLKQISSQISSNIASSREGNGTDRFSKMTSESSRKKKNVFRRNFIMDSDKENQSARDNYIQVQNTKSKVYNYQKEESQKLPKPSLKRNPSHMTNILSATSPSLSFQNLSSTREISAQNLQKNQTKGPSKSTMRKQPMSLGSTTTLVINEKAKALKDEISTLDDEIQQLQKNLKRAMSKREPITKDY